MQISFVNPSRTLKLGHLHTLRGAVLLRLTGPANASSEPTEGNDVFVFKDVLEVDVRLLES